MNPALKYLSLRRLKQLDKELSIKQNDLREQIEMIAVTREDIMTEEIDRKLKGNNANT